MDQTITLPDGRSLDIYVSGPDDGVPLIFHHGTPGARRPESAIERGAHSRGLRYVCASRPGYGASARSAGRRVVDVVPDIEAVLGMIGARECYVAGHSGGGPHALACAARLEGVRSTLVIAGVVPPDIPGFDFTAGMGEDNIVEFGKAFEGEAVLRPYLEEQRAGLLDTDAQAVVSIMESLLPDVDRAVMNDEIGAEIVAGFHEGLRDGVDGWIDDDLAFTTPWGFPLSSISSPVTVWQGDQDLMVPFSHGVQLSEAVPGADAHLLQGEGHLSIAVASAEAMLDALLTVADRRAA